MGRYDRGAYPLYHSPRQLVAAAGGPVAGASRAVAARGLSGTGSRGGGCEVATGGGTRSPYRRQRRGGAPAPRVRRRPPLICAPTRAGCARRRGLCSHGTHRCGCVGERARIPADDGTCRLADGWLRLAWPLSGASGGGWSALCGGVGSTHPERGAQLLASAHFPRLIPAPSRVDLSGPDRSCFQAVAIRMHCEASPSERGP